MEGTYPVLLGKQEVGMVQVLRQGLYYRFVCRCSATGQGIFRLMAACSKGVENLGVVVPGGDGFGLETRLPAKRFGEGEISFSLVPKLESMAGKVYPIYPDEPFAYISRLKDAYLTYVEGQAGILFIEDQMLSSKPTGQ